MAINALIRRSLSIIAMFVAVILLSAACSVTQEWTVTGSENANAPDAAVSDAGPAPTPPETLAFAEPEPEPEPDPDPSPELCEATAKIWIHTSTLSLLDVDATPEARQIALANVSEWLERATLLKENGFTDRAILLQAFTELRAIATTDFASDWQQFQVSTTYANEPAAETYETGRSAVVGLLTDRCPGMSVVELQTQAQDTAEDIQAQFATLPSTLVESESLPGHSIFTHGSGRLITSIPTAWNYEDRSSDALADLVASPDIERFLEGDAIDGVHLQLVEAATEDDFRKLIDATRTATSCGRTNDLTDGGGTRINVTQTFDCDDHGATIIGQYGTEHATGLIIEASFDRLDPSRADLIRLASIANSALWN